MIRTSVVEVTPEIAMSMLDGNLPPGEGGNRPLRQATVDQYARDMRAGAWLDNRAPLNFADDERFKWGVLLQGQHRLWAIVESGVTLTFVVNQGMDPATWDIEDTGLKRSLKDVLTRRGEVSVARLSAAINAHYRWMRMGEAFRFMSVRPPSHHEALAHLERNPGLRDAVRNAYGMHSTLKIRESVAVSLVHHLTMIDGDACSDFVTKLRTGEDMHKGDPVYAVRTWALNWASKTATPAAEFYLAVLIKAWNAQVLGKTLTTIQFRPANNEAFPVPLDLEGNPFPPRDQVQKDEA